jgi:hypothetical protein
VRDSLSLLEQVAALGAGTVDVGGVRRALGLADSEAFMRLVEAVAEQDAKSALELVAELAADGVDLRRFVSESVSFFRGAFLAHYAPNLAEIADEPADVYEAWRKAAQLVSASDVLRAVDLLGDALVRLREGREERLMTELALIKLTRPETASDTEALLARVERIERRLGKPDPVPAPTPAHAPASAPDHALAAASPTPTPEPDSAPTPKSAPDPETAVPVADAPAIDVSLEQLQKVWPGLFGSLRDVLGARRWAFFRESVPAGVEGNVILLEVPHGFHLQSLQEDDAVAAIVATRASDLLGGKVEVKFGLRETPADGRGDQTIDMSQLEERPATATDPTSLLAAELGAEVVEE